MNNQTLLEMQIRYRKINFSRRDRACKLCHFGPCPDENQDCFRVSNVLNNFKNKEGDSEVIMKQFQDDLRKTGSSKTQ